jgi:alpha-beta hydrolase superfamily lysophospholipase
MQENNKLQMNWLLLRGLVREQRHWLNFKDYFIKHNPNAKLFFLDFPGIGSEIHRTSPKSIEAIVLDFKNRLLQLKNQNPNDELLCIFAVSLGGMVALEWISKFENDFQIAVIGNSSSKLNPFYERFKTKNIFLIPKMFFLEDKVKRETLILKLTTNLDDKTIEKLATQQASFAPDLKKFRQTGLSQLFAASHWNISKKLKSTKTKILFLKSKYDQLVDSKCTDKLCDFVGQGHLSINSYANHDISLDAPDWCALEVANFVKNVVNN